MIEHIVRRGDTLLRIAEQHDVTLDDLLSANPQIGDPNKIVVEQKILIPAQGTPGAAPAPVEDDDEELSLDVDPNAILFLSEFQPKGASDRTARQAKLPEKGIRGVGASIAMAKSDRERMMEHKGKFIEAGRQFDLPPALLAAIASRENRGGAALKNGIGDNGHGFGLMQVDDRNPFPVVRDGGPFGQPHINQATGILKGKLDKVKSRFPELAEAAQLQMAVSRYNGGSGLRPPDSDRGTTGEED